MGPEQHEEEACRAYRCEIIPLALMTRCQGTVLELKCMPESAAGKDLRQTPTWRGLWAMQRVVLVIPAK